MEPSNNLELELSLLSGLHYKLAVCHCAYYSFSFSPPHSIQFCHSKEWEQVKISIVENFTKYKVMCVKWVVWSPTQSKHPGKGALELAAEAVHTRFLNQS